MVNNKKIFSKWLDNNTTNNLHKKEVLKNLDTLSILTGIKIYDLKNFNKEFSEIIIKKAKKLTGEELIDKFKNALNLYLKMTDK